MKILEIYNGEKNYVLPNGALGTKETVLEMFPAALDFTFVVTTNESREVMMAMDNLSILRDVHNIDNSLDDKDAIIAIQEIINTPVEVVETVSDETRIADALEDMVVLQELNSMEV